MSVKKDEETFGFEFRPDLYYSKDHIWVKVEADGNVRVGFDDIIAKGSHEIFMMKLLPNGTVAKAKGKIGIIESRKYTGPIVSPVGGTVVDVNPEIKRGGPTVIIDTPYEVWLSVLKPSSLNEDLKNLMTGDAALEWFKKEAEPLKDEMEHYNNVKKEASAKYEG
jgi:glycine cleavage system H protein